MGMTSVRMPDELLEQLQDTAERLRRSKGWIINDAVREYLVKEERESRMLEDTREALADVIDWLDSWGKDNEKTPPAL
jgi:predicted transcriptional regulator